MPHHVCHFAIHADDVERAKRFYGQVFGWRFRAWGPPEFYLIQTGPADDPGIHGALQKRHEPLSGTGLKGYECTVTVDDLAGIAGAIEENGGKLLSKEVTIPTVGTLFQFEDTEGNVACAMKYEADHRPELVP
jgi:hypothetical protein